MGVISFLSWRVFCFLDEQQGSTTNVIRRWLDEENVVPAQRSLLQLQIHLIESGGPEVVPGCIVPVGDEGFYTMNIATKGQPPITPVFCYGPFSDSEITLLTGAPIHKGLLQAGDVLPIARHNLDILIANPGRRRRERVT